MVRSDLHFLDTDNVPGAESLSYDFVGFRSPANATNFANVKDQPFSAAGDGRADDTAAIQAALDAMGQQGGGTVYLPQGQYRVTRLTVPTGVELRGPLGGGSPRAPYSRPALFSAMRARTPRRPRRIRPC